MTEEQLNQLDSQHSKFINLEHDLKKFQAELETLSADYKALIDSGYKTPEERKEMAKSDSLYIKVNDLNAAILFFNDKKDLIKSEIDAAREQGYLPPLERIEFEQAENKKRKEEMLKNQEVSSVA